MILKHNMIMNSEKNLRGFEMTPITIEGMGICPYCKSIEIKYGNHILDDNYLYFEITCEECKGESREYYSLEYEETVGFDEK